MTNSVTTAVEPAYGLLQRKLGAPARHIPRADLPAMFGPAIYGTVVSGDCLQPEICDGDIVVADPDATCEPGDFVVLVWAADKGTLSCKRLVSMPPPQFMKPAPGSEVVGVVEIEMLNPPLRGHVACDKLAAVHRVVHVIKGPRLKKRARRSKGGAA